MAEVYSTGHTGLSSGVNTVGTTADRGFGHNNGPSVDVNTAVVTPTDRVRWGPIIAGLFTALSTLALLSVLGVAVAGSAYDPGDSARNFGIGAGIWGAISTLVAFLIGGWLAARAAAVRGTHNGLLNGAMVWAVAIPVMLYMVAGAGMKAASTAAQTGAQVAMQRASNNSDDQAITASSRQDAQAGQQDQDIATQARSTASDVANRASAAATPENQERVADRTARTAWATLVSLLLALGAASLGGYLGARRTDAAHLRTAGA
jgi:hypothetical protein